MKSLEYIVDQYQANFDKLIVELKSYLPIIFYENGRSKLANAMIVDLCSPENPRRDYPENSFTVIEHLARGLMGINVDGGIPNVFDPIAIGKRRGLGRNEEHSLALEQSWDSASWNVQDRSLQPEWRYVEVVGKDIGFPCISVCQRK